MDFFKKDKQDLSKNLKIVKNKQDLILKMEALKLEKIRKGVDMEMQKA
jgi:hypothetical protein